MHQKNTKNCRRKEMAARTEKMGIDTGRITVSRQSGEKIVDGVRIEIPYGNAYALLGEDGRAKRLVLRIAAARVKDIAVCDDGSMICGLPISFGAAYTFDTNRLFSFMTCREYIKYGCSGVRMAKGAREARVNYLLDTVALTRRADTLISKLTEAEYLCLCVAFSMFNDPPLIIINADTLPFNKINRDTLNKLIFGLKIKNKAVIINLTDPRMCGGEIDKVGIMANGSLVLEGSPKELSCGTPKAYSIRNGGNIAELSKKIDEISDKYDIKIRGVKKPTLTSVYNKAVNK